MHVMTEGNVDILRHAYALRPLERREDDSLLALRTRRPFGFAHTNLEAFNIIIYCELLQ